MGPAHDGSGSSSGAAVPDSLQAERRPRVLDVSPNDPRRDRGSGVRGAYAADHSELAVRLAGCAASSAAIQGPAVQRRYRPDSPAWRDRLETPGRASLSRDVDRAAAVAVLRPASPLAHSTDRLAIGPAVGAQLGCVVAVVPKPSIDLDKIKIV